MRPKRHPIETYRARAWAQVIARRAGIVKGLGALNATDLAAFEWPHHAPSTLSERRSWSRWLSGSHSPSQGVIQSIERVQIEGASPERPFEGTSSAMTCGPFLPTTEDCDERHMAVLPLWPLLRQDLMSEGQMEQISSTMRQSVREISLKIAQSAHPLHRRERRTFAHLLYMMIRLSVDTTLPDIVSAGLIASNALLDTTGDLSWVVHADNLLKEYAGGLGLQSVLEMLEPRSDEMRGVCLRIMDHLDHWSRVCELENEEFDDDDPPSVITVRPDFSVYRPYE